MMYSRIKFICVNVFFIMKTNQESWKIVQFVRSTLNKKVIKKNKTGTDTKPGFPFVVEVVLALDFRISLPFPLDFRISAACGRRLAR